MPAGSRRYRSVQDYGSDQSIGSLLAHGYLEDQAAVPMRTFASTHTILRVEGGRFSFLIDPSSLRAAGRIRGRLR